MDQNQVQNQNVQSLDDLQKKIAEGLGVKDQSQATERQLELIDKATELILRSIFSATIEKLSEADAEAYTKLLEDEASPETIGKFLSDKIPGYGEMAQKIADDFVDGMKKAATS